jgi:hypothetical protein
VELAAEDRERIDAVEDVRSGGREHARAAIRNRGELFVECHKLDCLVALVAAEGALSGGEAVGQCLSGWHSD